MPEQLTNQAIFNFSDKKDSAESVIAIPKDSNGFIHGVLDNSKGEFDLVVEDMLGNIQMEKKGCSNPSGRWGERFDLPLRDDSYRIRIKNARNIGRLDLFVE